MPAGHALPGPELPEPLTASRLPRCRSRQAERNPTKIFLLKQMLRKAVGAEPGRRHTLREPGRHLKVFASAGGCQRFPGAWVPPAPLGSPPAPRIPPVPGADCNCSQAAPERESPNYPCQAAAKGVDVTARLLGTAWPPPQQGLRGVPGPSGFPQVGASPWPGPPGLEGEARPCSPPGEPSAAGYKGVKQLRGLIKGFSTRYGDGRHPQLRCLG